MSVDLALLRRQACRGAMRLYKELKPQDCTRELWERRQAELLILMSEEGNIEDIPLLCACALASISDTKEKCKLKAAKVGTTKARKKSRREIDKLERLGQEYIEFAMFSS